VCLAGHREDLGVAMPLFIDLLNDGGFSVRSATASTLVKLANQGVPHNTSQLSLTRETVDLRVTISTTIPSLVALVKDRDFGFRAIAALGQLAVYGTSHLNFSVLY
jgi:hypothetical protein